MSVDDIKIIGIIGAGQMGSGIATVAATSGYDAIMMDINEAQLEKGMAKIEHNLSRQLEKGLINDDERKAAMARIKTATTMNAFKDCDIIIEAASEDEKVKTKILKELFPLLKPDAIITTNTSSISITRLAAQTDRP
ncbi:MAG: NAD(P)-binding domain-containing protein, partial [Rhodospirillaceae bacterium]|nr:NAD(P)-binding domain-containing protein [Rhodospirillaceae bacterium]